MGANSIIVYLISKSSKEDILKLVSEMFQQLQTHKIVGSLNIWQKCALLHFLPCDSHFLRNDVKNCVNVILPWIWQFSNLFDTSGILNNIFWSIFSPNQKNDDESIE